MTYPYSPTFLRISVVTIFRMAFLAMLVTACDSDSNNSGRIDVPKQKPIPILSYSVDGELPHSVHSFTEGFLFHKGLLYESTGSPKNLPLTKSVYGVVDTLTGEIDVLNQLDKKYFGEGMVIFKDKVYQLTYQSKTGFIYDLSSGKLLGTFQIPAEEGWGMTHNGKQLIMSDGSPEIRFLDPVTLQVTRSMKVIDAGKLVYNLNELEFIDGFLYANIYQQNIVVKINPKNGKVMAKIDLSDLKRQALKNNSKSLETNGIAYNKNTGKLYVTGKMWPAIYIISLFD